MLDWFTTIPGILIVCGIILLVIAIILLMVGNKKSKKEINENPSVNTNVGTMQAATDVTNMGNMNNFMTSPMGDTMTPNLNATTSSVSPIEQVMVSNPDIPTASKVSEQAAPVVDIPTTPSTEEQGTTFSMPMVEEDSATHINDTVLPNLDNNLGVANEPTPLTVPTPEANQPSVISIPNIEKQEDSTNTNSIYGGENPSVNFAMPDAKLVTIYGGNDPLEATQALPKVEEAHELYHMDNLGTDVAGSTTTNVTPQTVEEVTPTIAIDPEMPSTAKIPDPVEVTPLVQPSAESIATDNASDAVKPIFIPPMETDKVEEL